MAKIVAYTALLYGKCYLASAIRSVIDHVSEYHVLYSPVGAHGHRTDVPCPDTREELLEIALSAGSKLRWHEGVWPHEGAQRDTILQVAGDADVILPVDYDEVWQTGLVEEAIAAGLSGKARNWRVPFRHYWRSFYRAFLHDPAYPVRIIAPKVNSGDATLSTDKAVNHCGYCIPKHLMEFKWKVHGHHNELRRDVDWFNDVYCANRQYDCHPVGSDAWNTEEVDPSIYFPEFMKSHPFWGLEVIE
jgi:hypothetical protein